MRSPLAVRVTAPMILASLMALAIGVLAARHLHAAQVRNSEILTLDFDSMRDAEDLEIRIREVRNALNRYLRTRNRRELEVIPDHRAEAAAKLRDARAGARLPREVELLDVVGAGYSHFFAEYDRLAPLPADHEIVAQLGTLVDELMAREIFRPAREYVELHRDSVARASAENLEATDRLGLGLVVLGICGAVAGSLAGFGIARGINRSIVQLSVPIRDAAGKLNEVVGPIRVSAGSSFEELEALLSQLAEQIAAVVARLQRSERDTLRAEQLAAVGQLAAGLAHELRNPLMPMRMLVQSAAERGPGGLSPRDLAVIDEEITRLDRSIQGFLDFARPPQPDKHPFDLRAVVAQSIELVSRRALEQEVAIECSEPEHPVELVADAGQIRQVVLNLLLNALDAQPCGGRIEIELSRPGAVVVRVSDTGPGIPATIRARIFQPFVSTKEVGIGLGLSICSRILEAHGGTIEVADRPRGGAAFTVRMPSADHVLCRAHASAAKVS